MNDDARIGTTISHYRVLSRLGKGGMGVVYRAEDLSLGREAALKILPENAAPDSDTFLRFSREARSASALNHPNICTIYEFGEADGHPFLAMELLEGVSLDTQLTGQPMPLDRLLNIGVQAADGLSAAHAKSIVHRDIKPANIFLVAQDHVKLLDFGLAKLEAIAAAEPAQGRTLPPGAVLTHAGAAIGTIAYMSPEQARGEPLDARTDIFSLGVVLYQLATGQHPFPGPTTAVIFDQILNRDPGPAIEKNPALPAELDAVLRRALEKDRELRFQSAADLRAELRRLQRTSGANYPSSAAITAATVAAPARQRRSLPRRRVWAAIAAVLLLAALGAVWSTIRHKPFPFQHVTLRQMTDSGDIQFIAMSQDGKTLAEVKAANGQQSLWIRNLPTNVDTQVLAPQPGNFVDVTFTPDGNWIFYSREPNSERFVRDLYSVSVLGGKPESLIHDADSSASFSPDGSRFVYLRQTPEFTDHFAEIHVANRDLSNDHVVYTGSQPTSMPRWMRDPNHIVWVEAMPSATNHMKVENVDTRKVSEMPSPAATPWIRQVEPLPGDFAIAIDAPLQSDGRQVLTVDTRNGRTHAVTNDLSNYQQPTSSGDGHDLAVISALQKTTLQVGSADLNNMSPPIDLHITPTVITWMNDNQHLLAFSTYHLRMVDTKTGEATILNVGDIAGPPAQCPDGSILFPSVPAGASHSVLMRAEADGSHPRVADRNGPVRRIMCTPGNVVYYAVQEANRTDVDIYRLAPGSKPEVFARTKGAFGFSISRDGRYLVAGRGDSADPSVMLRDVYDTTDMKAKPRTYRVDTHSTLRNMTLTPDNKSLLDETAEGGQLLLHLQPMDGSAGRTVVETLQQPITSMDFSPDGKQVAMIRTTSTSNVVLIHDDGDKQ